MIEILFIMAFLEFIVVSIFWLGIFLSVMPKEKKEKHPFYKFIGDIYEV